MEMNLNLKQEQKLILTQEMKVSMEILQMPVVCLSEFIEKERLTNDAIEVSYVGPSEPSGGGESFSYLEMATEKENFFDYLENQLSTFQIPAEIEQICRYILNNLDNRGYLIVSKENLIRELKIKREKLYKALEIIHTMDPVGVGAENVKECLKIQLRARNITSGYIYSIIDLFWEDLGYGKYAYIADKLKIREEDVLEALRVIRTLNPIPARGFLVEKDDKYVVPEGKIEINDGGLTVSLNQDAMPKIRINTNYPCNSSLEKRNLQRAMYLIKAVEKRYETLERILNILAAKQSRYFFEGRDNLKDLVLRDVARELDMHQSTVSRAIKDKYIYTPYGTISIKSLLKRNCKSIGIKKAIEDLIRNEDRENPVSDNDIRDAIAKECKMNISRRAIAKYREELGIPSSRERRIR